MKSVELIIVDGRLHAAFKENGVPVRMEELGGRYGSPYDQLHSAPYEIAPFLGINDPEAETDHG